MRFLEKGDSFKVVFSLKDAEDFREKWPCFGVKGSGWAVFDDRGDLVDCSPNLKGSGSMEFSRDLQAYGVKQRGINAVLSFQSVGGTIYTRAT